MSVVVDRNRLAATGAGGGAVGGFVGGWGGLKVVGAR